MNRNGFTLIEVSLGLLIAVIIAAYAAKTITSTNRVVATGRETFIATNLAHDGIDLTRAMRDNTWFAFPDDRSIWMSKSGICETTENKTYTIDAENVREFRNHDFIINPNSPVGKVRDARNQTLSLQPGSTVLTHGNLGSGAEQSPYSRRLDAACGNVNDSVSPFVEITSTVEWVGQSGSTKSVVIKERLYNWLP